MANELINRVKNLASFNKLDLLELRLVCPGVVSAVQRLTIGNDLVCTDNILIEEVCYNSIEKLQYEIKNLVIKKGAFSEFEKSSTPMPKYCYPQESRLKVYFVVSVHHVSFDRMLSVIEEKYPSRYTYDFILCVRDYCKWLYSLIKKEIYRKDRFFLQSLRIFRDEYRKRTFRVSIKARLKLAFLLVSYIRDRHLRDIFQNNICPNLIFVTSTGQLKFFSNYSGVDSQVLQHYIPEQVLCDSEHRVYGPQFKDVYSLSLLCYNIITGEQIDGRNFSLEAGPKLLFPFLRNKCNTADKKSLFWKFDRFAKWLSECLGNIRKYFFEIADESKFVEFRRLVRASGSPIRNVPLLRPYLDIWFPTRPARILRNILDYDFNQSFFCRRLRAISSKKHTINANAEYLLAGLDVPKRYMYKKTKLDKLIQKVASQISFDITNIEDEQTAAFSKRFLPRVTMSKIFLWPAVFVCVAFVGSLIFVKGIRLSNNFWGVKTTLINEAKSYKQKDNILNVLGSSKELSNAEATEQHKVKLKKSQTAIHKTERQVKLDTTSSITLPHKLTPKDSAYTTVQNKDNTTVDSSMSSDFSKGAMLVLVDKSHKVYRFAGLGRPMNLADVLWYKKDGQLAPLREHANKYTKFFICRKERNGYGPIRPVRLCRGTTGKCEEGNFYEAVGYSGTAAPAIVHDGDLFAYGYLELYYYKRKIKEP